jgi:hypothetical protein
MPKIILVNVSNTPNTKTHTSEYPTITDDLLESHEIASHGNRKKEQTRDSILLNAISLTQNLWQSENV